MGPCVLVFGVSGVGKTSACADYAARHPKILSVSASSLLKAATAASGESLRTASAQVIRHNQSRLAKALSDYRAGREEFPILVDAHAVIDNDEEFVRVPLTAIQSIGPNLLILLEAPPDRISAHRTSDVRPRPLRSIEAISREMKAERAAVSDYAAALGIDLLVAEVRPGFRLDDLLKDKLSRSAH